MNINWKVRFKNKTFWMTIIPALLLLITQVLNMFGVNIDLSKVGTQLLSIVTTVFGILAILGIVTDHTTEGFSDSANALTYDEPKTREDDEING